jgi:cell wall-associated NlpC family hydrolase
MSFSRIYKLKVLFLISLASCKPSSTIVTSKEQAQKKGMYEVQVGNQSNTRTTTENRTVSQRNTNESFYRKKTILNDKDDPDYVPDNDNTSYLVKQLINTASQFEGVRYRGGGTTTAGMDCSGLVTTVFKTFDISLPRSSFDMAKVGKKVSKNEIQKGDLVFFKTNGRNVINHVGLVTEVRENEIIFIHSSVQRGVIFSSTKEPYYQRTFAQANRVL